MLVGSFTVSAWIKTTNQVGNDLDALGDNSGQSVIYMNNNANGLIPLGITGSKAAFFTGTSSSDTLHSAQSVTTGSYVHVVVTRNAATGEKDIYVNGVLDASDTGAVGILDGGADNVSIGGTSGTAYTGEIDDVQIYAGVLSASEVAQLYQNPGTTTPNILFNDLAARYNFDQGAALALDVSGNFNSLANAGNIGGTGPVLTTSAIEGAGAVSFDGGSYLTAAPGLLPTLAGSFSVSLWLKTTQSFGDADDWAYNGAGIVAAGRRDQDHDLIPIALTAGQVAFNEGYGGNDNTLNSSGTVNDGNWHHVVVTRDQLSGQRQIFIDGVLDSSDTAATLLLNGPKLITIGALADARNQEPSSPNYTGYNGYQGLLDDIQVYARALSAADVAFLYTNIGSTVARLPQQWISTLR